MADIRINSLPTTASASSSDDFLALDGATNGTRKLNAFSPTFGGNLTVNGGTVDNSPASGGPLFRSIRPANTGSAAFASIPNGALSASNVEWYSGLIGSSGDYKIWAYNGSTNTFAFSSTPAGNVTLAGNLTVSGTGTSSFSGILSEKTAAMTNPVLIGEMADSTTVGVVSFSNSRTSSAMLGIAGTTTDLFLAVPSTGTFQFRNGWTEQMRLFANGNLFIGASPVDSGNGKLQLATHTTSAGGIGLGTDTSIYSNNSGQISIDHVNGTSPLLVLRGSGSNKAAFYSNSGNAYIDVNTAGGSLYFRPNGGTLALTLDSSQNATFAGTVTANSTMTLKNGGSYVIADGSGNVLGRYYLTGGNSYLDYQGTLNMRASSGAGSVTSIDTSGNATFAGKIISGGAGSTYQLNVRGIGYFDRASGSAVYVDPGVSSGGMGTANNYPLIITSNSTSAITISTAQALRFHAYGAGTLTTDASGNVTASSDARLKTNLRTFARGLTDVLKLSPKTYNWNETSGLETEHDYVGFVAQDVANAIPEAVYEGKDANKTLTLNDRAILAALVNAVKELNAKLA